jgi:cell division protein FtsB
MIEFKVGTHNKRLIMEKLTTCQKVDRLVKDLIDENIDQNLQIEKLKKENEELKRHLNNFKS